MTLVLKNVRVWSASNGAELTDFLIEDGKISGNEPSLPVPSDATVIDGQGLLALPGFVNAHAHIDKSWLHRDWVSNQAEPSTQGCIAFEREKRDELNIPSVEVTETVLRQMLAFGTTRIRSHIDVDLGVGLRGLETVAEAVDNLNGAVEVEVVAFPQDGVIRRPGVRDLLKKAASSGVAHIGGLDPCLIDRDPAGQLNQLFEIASEYDCGLDIHLHDAGTLGHFEYEMILQRIHSYGRQGKVNIAHGFALSTVPSSRQESLIKELGEAGVSWSTVAPIGSARLPLELMKQNSVRLGLGTDGIRDLWSPYGDGDMLRVAQQFARLHGFKRDEELASAVDLITQDASWFVGNDRNDFTMGSLADIVLVDALHPMDALVRAPRRELVIAGGHVVVREGELLI